MIKSLTLPLARVKSSENISWRSFQAIAQAILWPDRWLAGAWLFTLGLLLVGILSKIALPIFAGALMLMGLHLSIPIQINNLTGRKSWLLLPGFKPLILLFLAGLQLIWLLTIFVLIWDTPNPTWIALPYTALIFSLVMLPAIYVRHLWPLLVLIFLLMIIAPNQEAVRWLKTNGTTLWFAGVIVVSVLAMWLLMGVGWLHSAQRERNETKKTSVYAFYGIEIQPLLRLTRRPASLAGMMLFGDGDSWPASVVRAILATWLVPSFILLTDLLFRGSPSELWHSHWFLALIIASPLFTLAAQQQKSAQRLGRCWLYLHGSRQAMYQFVERAFYQELIAHFTMILILALILIPLPMVLPLLCCAAAATIFLCYLIFALVGLPFWWSISANLILLLALMVTIDFLWETPQLIYLLSLILIVPVVMLRRFGKAYWLKLDYTQLKPRQLL